MSKYDVAGEKILCDKDFKMKKENKNYRQNEG